MSTDQRPKKSISFNPSVLARYHKPLSDFTPEERQQCWFQRKDIETFRKDVKNTAYLIDSGFDLDDGEFCRRGAECKTEKGEATYARHRQMAKTALDRETLRQYRTKTIDEVELARVYMEATESARVAATLVGAADAEAVRPSKVATGKEKAFFYHMRSLHVRLFASRRKLEHSGRVKSGGAA